MATSITVSKKVYEELINRKAGLIKEYKKEISLNKVLESILFNTPITENH